MSPIVIVLFAVGLAACSSDTSLSEEDVTQTISDFLESETGTAPEDISCGSEIEGEVGNKLSCTATSDGTTLELSVEVTEVTDDEVKYEVTVVG